MSNFVGPELTDALSALVSLTSVALLLRVWQPAEEFTEGARLVVASAAAPDTGGRVVRAYATYGILIVTVLIGQIGNFAGMSDAEAAGQRDGAAQVRPGRQQAVSRPVVRTDAPPSSRRASASRCGSSTGRAPTRSSDGKIAPLVQREAPVVAASSPYPLTYRLDFLAAAGTLVFLAALIAFVPMLMFGVPLSALGTTFDEDRPAAATAGDHDRVHSVDRDRDELLGDDLVDGARAREDGRAVSVLRGVARHDRRLPDRQRHLVEHAVRPAAGDDRQAVGARSGADGGDQQFRRA